MSSLVVSRCRVMTWAAGVVAFASLVVAQVAQKDVTLRTSLDRTALWVGDRVTYTIEVTCARGVDVLADDGSRDKLKLDGLEVVDADTNRRNGADGSTIYLFRYVLTTYRVDVPAPSIGPLTIRYAVRRSGQRLEDAAPAGDVQAPGATLALRSVLPDDTPALAIRSDEPPHERPARYANLQPVAIALIVVSAVPAAVALAAFVRRARRPRLRRSARTIRHEEQASLDAVRALPADTVERRREVFTRLDGLVRDHLSEACGVPGRSLTPHEAPFALATGRTSVPAELVASVLATCEVARYAPADAMPSADACRQAIEQVEQIVRGNW